MLLFFRFLFVRGFKSFFLNANKYIFTDSCKRKEEEGEREKKKYRNFKSRFIKHWKHRPLKREENKLFLIRIHFSSKKFINFSKINRKMLNRISTLNSIKSKAYLASSTCHNKITLAFASSSSASHNDEVYFYF